MHYCSQIESTRSLKALVGVIALVALVGCGGGELGSAPVEQLKGARSVNTEAIAKPAAAPLTARTEIVRKVNTSDKNFVRESTVDSIARSIALLDAAGIQLNLVDCGVHGLSADEGGPSYGSIEWPPVWMKFSISSDDLQKALTIGFELYDPADGYTFLYRTVCGDLTLVLDPANRIFNMAPIAYPDLFPGPGIWGDWEGYRYALFSSGTYVGVKNGRVFLHNGKNWFLQDVGPVGAYIKGLPE